MCERNNIFTFVPMNACTFRNINRLVVLFLLATLGLLAFNSTANYHLHRLPNGELIAHAHPYSKDTNPDSPYPTHKHTQFEFYFFSSVSLLFIIGFLMLERFEIHKKLKYQPFAQSIFFCNTPEQVTNKAPPVL